MTWASRGAISLLRATPHGAQSIGHPSSQWVFIHSVFTDTLGRLILAIFDTVLSTPSGHCQTLVISECPCMMDQSNLFWFPAQFHSRQSFGDI